MTKIMTVDYYAQNECIGGVQSLMGQFKDIDKDCKNTSFFNAIQTLGIPMVQPNQLGMYFEFFASQVIQEYIDKYETLFPADDRVIIKNSIVETMKKHKSPMISTIWDNNILGPEALQNHYDPITFRRFRYGFTHMQKNTFEKSAAIVANSNHVKDCYDKEFGINSTVIESCVDTEVFKPLKNKDELREKYKIPKDKPVCISSTAMHPIKNFHAISQLIKDFPDVFFLLVFKHPLQNQKIKSKNVKLWFNVPRDQLVEFYNLADFKILPSLMECDNVSVKEAMASGIPILTSKVGQFWDFWDDKLGQRVENPSDYNEIKEKFGLLLKNYKELNPRSIVCKNWDMNVWKNKWNDVIKGVLEKS